MLKDEFQLQNVFLEYANNSFKENTENLKKVTAAIRDFELW
jgi:hypothetical protein